ncbi:anthrax toxin-like adenylyl cyclase domain-containing protein [Serratia proteamaculans]
MHSFDQKYNLKKNEFTFLSDEQENQDTPIYSSALNRPGETFSCQLDKFSGIPKEHREVFLEYAKKNNIIFGFRPVSPIATTLIKEGLPTKGYHIKGKSSDWGPQAGFICCDQSLSKLAGRHNDIKSYNEKVQQCIKSGHANAGPLVISAERLSELQKNNFIELSSGVEGNLELKSKSPDGQVHTFSALKQGEHNYKIMKQGQEVKILYHHVVNKPLVPDYDMLLIAPHISDYSSADSVAPYKRDDPDHGAVSERLQQFTDNIHKQLKRDVNYEVIQHCTDANNRATDITANYPAVLFSPHAFESFDEVTVINNTSELADYIKQAKDAGFQVPVNKRWQGVQGILRRSFLEARSNLEHKLSSRTGNYYDLGGRCDFLKHRAYQQGVNASIAMTASRRKGFEKSRVTQDPSIKLLTYPNNIFTNTIKQGKYESGVKSKLLNIGKFDVEGPDRIISSNENRFSLPKGKSLRSVLNIDDAAFGREHSMDLPSYLENRIPGAIVELINKNGSDIFFEDEGEMMSYYSRQGFDTSFKISGPTSTMYHLITSSESGEARLVISNIKSNARFIHNVLQLLHAGANLDNINVIGSVEEAKRKAATELSRYLERCDITSNDLLYVGSRTPVMKYFSQYGGRVTEHRISGFIFDSVPIVKNGAYFNVYALRMPNGDLAYDAVKQFLDAGVRNVIMCGAGGIIAGNASVGDYLTVTESTYLDNKIVASDISKIIAVSPGGYINKDSSLNVTVDSPLEEDVEWNKKNKSKGNVDVETFHIFKAIKDSNHTIKLVSGLFVSDVLGEHPLDEKINSGGAHKNITSFIKNTEKAYLSSMSKVRLKSKL